MADLTARQLTVLRFLAEGKTHRQVSLLMRVSRQTVDRTSRQILVALGAANTAHAVAIAYDNGIMGRRRQHVPGTTYGVRWHYFYHVPMCDACHEFDKSYRRDRRRTKDGEDAPPVRD